tara:strand:+ start:1175 stop:1339 length:165 start_codon:yes stop_codon:yes gene_type:complete
MAEITEEQLNELKGKMEETKVLYLKYVGAVEVMESLMSIPSVPEKSKKVLKKSK